MAQNAPEEDRLFQPYSFCPPEIQMMIVDEMPSAERCRFTRCSRSSNKKAKSSKNYLYSLGLFCEYEEDIQIFVYNRYKLRYQNKPEEKCMKYFNYSGQELWRIDFCPSTDVIAEAINNFKEMLKFYQRIIRDLEIHGEFICDRLRNVDFGIECFYRLRNLKVFCDIDITPLLSKVRNPLNELIQLKGTDLSQLTRYPQIYECVNELNISRLKLTYEQLISLSAERISIHIGELSPQDIARFIRSWQNDTLPDTFYYCHWRLKYSTFDVPKLCRLLNIPTDGDTFPEEVTFKHNDDESWIAKLTLPHSTPHFFENSLTFSIPYDY